MYKKILIIANLKAGKAKLNKRDINKIEKNFLKKNIEVHTEFTSLEKSATDILRDYENDYDLIYVCGGDGTLNQVNQALCDMDKKIPIAYIPTGTTNDLAKSLKLSFDKLDLSTNIEEYVEKEYDIGTFNDKYFDYVASIGLFSKTSYATSYETKNRFGKLGYVILGIKEFFHTKPVNLRISVNDEIIEDEFIYGSITNSFYIGGFKLFKRRDIDLKDGKFEVIFVKNQKNIFKKLLLLCKIVSKNLNDDNIYFFQAKELKIESETDTEWSIDGEYSGKIKNIEIKNLKKKAIYLIPKHQ